MNRHLRESPKSLDKSTPRTLELDQEALSPIPINQMGHRKAHDATLHTLHSVHSGCTVYESLCGLKSTSMGTCDS